MKNDKQQVALGLRAIGHALMHVAADGNDLYHRRRANYALKRLSRIEERQQESESIRARVQSIADNAMRNKPKEPNNHWDGQPVFVVEIHGQHAASAPDVSALLAQCIRKIIAVPSLMHGNRASQNLTMPDGKVVGFWRFKD